MDPDRNYAADMRAVLDAETAHGPYTAPAAALAVVDKLRANDPDLLDGWLHTQAVSLIRDAIGTRDASRRGAARHHAARSVFADAAAAFADGDDEAMRGFLSCPYVVNQEGWRKPLASLTQADLMFVADSYAATEREAALEKAWVRAIAKKVGPDRTVGEVFAESELARLRASIHSRSQAKPVELPAAAVPRKAAKVTPAQQRKRQRAA